MGVILRDDSGAEVELVGDWIGNTVGADFTNGGQILTWLRPGPDASARRIERPIALPRTQEHITPIAATSSAPRRLTEGN